MIGDVVRIFKNNFENDSLSIVFPRILDDLKGQDANFEMIQSNTLQQIKLIYNDNIVTHSIAAIFVHTRYKAIVADVNDNESGENQVK